MVRTPLCRKTTEMGTEEYDYSQSVHFLEEFENPFVDKLFIEELEESYDKL